MLYQVVSRRSTSINRGVNLVLLTQRMKFMEEGRNRALIVIALNIMYSLSVRYDLNEMTRFHLFGFKIMEKLTLT